MGDDSPPHTIMATRGATSSGFCTGQGGQDCQEAPPDSMESDVHSDSLLGPPLGGNGPSWASIELDLRSDGPPSQPDAEPQHPIPLFDIDFSDDDDGVPDPESIEMKTINRPPDDGEPAAEQTEVKVSYRSAASDGGEGPREPDPERTEVKVRYRSAASDGGEGPREPDPEQTEVHRGDRSPATDGAEALREPDPEQTDLKTPTDNLPDPQLEMSSGRNSPSSQPLPNTEPPDMAAFLEQTTLPTSQIEAHVHTNFRDIFDQMSQAELGLVAQGSGVQVHLMEREEHVVSFTRLHSYEQRQDMRNMEYNLDHLRIHISEFGFILQLLERCIMLQLMVLNRESLERLAQPEGCSQMESKLKELIRQWREVRGEDVSEVNSIVMKVSQEDIQRSRQFFELEPLDTSVRFAYCRHVRLWYWSADSDLDLWQREDLLVVQGGALKGRRLMEDDLERLAKLKCIKVDPRPDDQCPICVLKKYRPGKVFEGPEDRTGAGVQTPSVLEMRDYFTEADWKQYQNLESTMIKFLATCNEQKYKAFLENCIHKSINVDLNAAFGDLPDEIRVILIGKTGAGKSSTANTIFEKPLFKTSRKGVSMTQHNQVHSILYRGKRIRVLDTPGLIDTSRTPAEVAEEIAKLVEVFPDGIHAFLYIMNIAHYRFTPEDRQAIAEVKELFGPEVMRRIFIVFTHADVVLKTVSLNQYIVEQERGTPLAELIVTEAKNRVVAVENDTDVGYIRRQQRDQLFTTLCFLLKDKDYQPFDNAIFRKAQKQGKERQKYFREEKTSKMKFQSNHQKKLFIKELYEALETHLERALGDAGLYNSAGVHFEEQRKSFDKNQLSKCYREALKPILMNLKPATKEYFVQKEALYDEVVIQHIKKRYTDFSKLTEAIRKKLEAKGSTKWWSHCAIL